MMARRLALVSGIVALWLVSSGSTRADRIRMRGGGEIRGVLVSGGDDPKKVRVQTETGSRPMVLDREQVVQVIAEDDPLDDYFARRDTVPTTAAAQFEFGRWCETRRLSGLAMNHYRRAAELDKTFAPAQKKLGRVLHDGEWMTYDEMRRAQGLVQHKGRWISREEAERIAESEARAASRASWVRQIQVLRENAESADEGRRADAIGRLEAIRDPEAVPALSQVLRAGTPADRARLARILGAIPGEESREALIALLLTEEDGTVGQAILDELVRRGDPETGEALVRRLSARDPRRSGRVASVLAALGVEAAIPRLIPLLVRQERRAVLVPQGEASPPPVMATFVQGGSYPILTGPAVGPGVVAYGATSVPYGSGAMLSYGGGGASGPTMRMATTLYRNAEVLSALESLTGRDYGYDVAAWRRWWVTSRRPEPAVRRVPQP